MQCINLRQVGDGHCNQLTRAEGSLGISVILHIIQRNIEKTVGGNPGLLGTIATSLVSSPVPSGYWSPVLLHGGILADKLDQLLVISESEDAVGDPSVRACWFRWVRRRVVIPP